jgi:hypothetical protein
MTGSTFFVPKLPTWFAKSDDKKKLFGFISFLPRVIAFLTKHFHLLELHNQHVSKAEADTCVRPIRHINVIQNSFCKPRLILNTTAEKVVAKINTEYCLYVGTGLAQSV